MAPVAVMPGHPRRVDDRSAECVLGRFDHFQEVPCVVEGGEHVALDADDESVERAAFVLALHLPEWLSGPERVERVEAGKDPVERRPLIGSTAKEQAVGVPRRHGDAIGIEKLLGNAECKA